jgi:hypothetical protein
VVQAIAAGLGARHGTPASRQSAMTVGNRNIILRMIPLSDLTSTLPRAALSSRPQSAK